MRRRCRARARESEAERVIFISSDDEANADLSLAIVTKSQLRETKRKRADDKEKNLAFFIDLSTSSAEEIEVVSNGKSAGGSDRLVVAAAEEMKKKRKNRPKKKKAEKKNVKEVIVTEQPDVLVVETQPARNSDSVIEVGIEASSNLILKKLLRGPRYFDPGNESWEICFNCGEDGHTAVNCKEEKRQKPCFVCGMFGHNAKRCMQVIDCFVCKRRGHHAKDCPDKRKIKPEETVMCLRCGDFGHDMTSCRNNYASCDIKEIQCYICKEYGHLCCVAYKDSGPNAVSCYNCAASGHTGQGCAKLRGENAASISPTLCYRCGLEGHFARGCTKSPKSAKHLSDPSTPLNRLKVKKHAKASKSLLRGFERGHTKKSPCFDNSMRPTKSRIKGGWIVDDSGYLPKRKHKAKDWASPTPPTSLHHSNYLNYSSSPYTPHQRYDCFVGTPRPFGSTVGRRHGFSVPRYGYSHGFYA